MSDKELKYYLDKLYKKYHKKFSSKDPVWHLHNFKDKRDIETSGFITSCYSYGRVENINKFISKFLNVTGNKVHEFTCNYSEHKDKKFLKDLNYRFNPQQDLSLLLKILKRIYEKHKSLEDLFMLEHSAGNENILPALKRFTGEFNISVPEKNSFRYLVPLAENGSACKRLNLFLRWMVRNDEIDTGIWNKVDTSALIIPVDVHVFRVSRKLNLVQRNTCDMKFALALTDKLKEFDPADPVKYDFAICHISMEKGIEL